MTVPWHYDNILERYGLSYSDWRMLVLAPIISVGLVNGFSDQERIDLIYFARDHGLLARHEDDEQALSCDLERLIGDLSFLTARERALDQFLIQLPEQLGRQVASQIWDTAVELALSTWDNGMPIALSEKEALTRVALFLRLGDTQAVSKVLGSSARLLSAPRAATFESAKAAPEAKKAHIWASEWKLFGPTAWQDLNALVEAHESASAGGKGRLDGRQSLEDLQFPNEAFVDSGVVVLPRCTEERDVYIIGDLHGDYDSLELALKTTSVENQEPRPLLIFLGDYGDRGPNTLAVWLRLAELKRLYPNDICLLRGNHEDVMTVRCVRQLDGRALSREWQLPFTTNNDSFIALSFALENNFANVGVLYDSLPAVALFPDGTVALHGGPVPRWKENDGWKMAEEAKEDLRISTLADLRKPKAQFVMRWVDILDKKDVDMAWSEYGAGSRLSAAALDLTDWEERFGISRVVHGHTHPSSGFEWACEKKSLALNTSLATGRVPAIARWKPNILEPIVLESR